MDFAVARRMMVDGQILTRDVFDTDLLAAMLEVITFIVVAADNYRLGRVMYQVVEIVGKQIGLTPVNGKAK